MVPPPRRVPGVDTGWVDVVLVRHGETEWSASGRHTSFTDVALTARGERQADELAARLVGRRFDVVLTSPRRRARDTCARAGLVERAEVCEDLAEWNYGTYEGLTTARSEERRVGKECRL